MSMSIIIIIIVKCFVLFVFCMVFRAEFAMCHMLSSQYVNKQQSNTSINNSKLYYGCNWSNYNNTFHRKRVHAEPSRRPLQSIRTQTCYTISCNQNKAVSFISSSSLFGCHTSIERHCMNHLQMVSRAYNVYECTCMQTIHYTL